VHKMRRIFRLAEELLASQEGLCYMALFISVLNSGVLKYVTHFPHALYKFVGPPFCPD
jgi:hypothetical protein